LKRWRARAMGSAAPIKKRTSHIAIILTDGKPVAKKESAK
jgi:ribosomal protein L22